MVPPGQVPADFDPSFGSDRVILSGLPARHDSKSAKLASERSGRPVLEWRRHSTSVVVHETNVESVPALRCRVLARLTQTTIQSARHIHHFHPIHRSRHHETKTGRLAARVSPPLPAVLGPRRRQPTQYHRNVSSSGRFAGRSETVVVRVADTSADGHLQLAPRQFGLPIDRRPRRAWLVRTGHFGDRDGSHPADDAAVARSVLSAFLNEQAGSLSMQRATG